MDKISRNAKRKARKLGLQALYQWLMSGQDLNEIEAQFCSINNMEKVDGDYFHRILFGVVEHKALIEEKLLLFLDRPIASLNPIELSVLRLGTFELLFCPEIPYRVVLDESISLAKNFGSQDGHRYVNGILHFIAQKERLIEIDLEK